MTRRELDTARKRLKAIAVIEAKKACAPAKLFYRIDFDRLITLINEFEPSSVTNKDGDSVQTSLAHSAKLQCTIPPNSLIYTEITSETTSSGGKAKNPDDDADVVIAEQPKPDPFFTGQHRAIAREIVKVSREFNAPKNFITDAPWGQLADEVGKDPLGVWKAFEQFMTQLHADKQDPIAYCGKIANNLYQNPGSELACKPWIEFADYFRKNLTAPPAPKKSEPRPVEIEQIPDREASREAFRRLKG